MSGLLLCWMPFDLRLPSDRHCLRWFSKAGCFPSRLWLQIQDSSSILPPLALESACGQILQRGTGLSLDPAVVQEAPKLAAGVTMIRIFGPSTPFPASSGCLPNRVPIERFGHVVCRLCGCSAPQGPPYGLCTWKWLRRRYVLRIGGRRRNGRCRGAVNQCYRVYRLAGFVSKASRRLDRLAILAGTNPPEEIATPHRDQVLPSSNTG